jgi:hypothetical protein
MKPLATKIKPMGQRGNEKALDNGIEASAGLAAAPFINDVSGEPERQRKRIVQGQDEGAKRPANKGRRG